MVLIVEYANTSTVYSFGMVLYTILCLREPFEDEDEAIIPSLVAQYRRPKLPAWLLSLASPEQTDFMPAPSLSSSLTINFASVDDNPFMPRLNDSTSNLSAVQYRNLIDLYEFCTAANANKRPPIEVVVAALSRSDSIKQWWRPPTEDNQVLLEEWLFYSRSGSERLSKQDKYSFPDRTID